MLGSLSEADDAVQDAWLRLSRADTRERRQPRRLADHGGGPGVPEHAARAPDPARGAAGRCSVPDPIISREPGCGSGAGGGAGRLGRAGAAGGAGHADPGRAARVRAARHVRRAVRGDRPDAGPVAGRGPAAGQPGPAAGHAGRAPAARRRPRPAAARSSTRSSPPPGTATSRRWSRCSTRTWCCGRTGRSDPAPNRSCCAGPGWSPEGATAAGERARFSAAGARQRRGRAGDGPAGKLFLVLAFTIVDDLITAIDVIADPERLRTLKVSVLLWRVPRKGNLLTLGRRPGTHLAAFSSVALRLGSPPSSALRCTHLNAANRQGTSLPGH